MPSAKRDSPPSKGDAELVEALVMEILGAFFDLRAAGREQGLVTDWGGGGWGLMRLLEHEGPSTVPEVARRRGVSRQYIQKLANELIAQGLMEMVDNPAHRRSRLMRLTPAGRSEFEVLTQRFRASMRALAPGLRNDEMRTTIDTVAELRRRLAAHGPEGGG